VNRLEGALSSLLRDLPAEGSAPAIVGGLAVSARTQPRFTRDIDVAIAVADLLFASSGIEHEVVAAAELLEVFAGLVLPIAQIGHLIALKLLSRDDRTRPQDVADLRALFEVASEIEIARAHEAVRLIQQRGFSRGRDLMAALAEWRTGAD
jgi:predicted nucleotidyltransferase